MHHRILLRRKDSAKKCSREEDTSKQSDIEGSRKLCEEFGLVVEPLGKKHEEKLMKNCSSNSIQY